MEEKKFIVDCMLGKLSRWLRILGFDTQYVRYLNDMQILTQARYQGRTLLTRDTALFKKAGDLAYLVRSESIEKQLHEVMVHFHLRPDYLFTRCPHCNALLQPTNQGEERPFTPLYVSCSFPNIKICPECHQSYWPGTHWLNIIKKNSIQSPLTLTLSHQSSM